MFSVSDRFAKRAAPLAGGSGYPYAIKALPDGKTVVASGVNGDFFVARFNANGTIDTTFGTNGVATTDFTPSSDVAQSIAVQSDGKIIVSGAASGRVLIARYNVNGTLDTSFGTSGKVNLPAASGNVYWSAEVVAQPDGKIVVGARETVSGNSNCTLLRFLANGTLDSGFGTAGRVVMDSGGYDTLLNVILQPDGKLIASGNRSYGQYIVARYNADGSPDAGFGTAGRATIVSGASGGTAVLQPNGKIVVTGVRTTRLNTNGTIDTSFGTAGWAETPNATYSAGYSDGKFMIFSTVTEGGRYVMHVARYTANGAPDTTFGSGGTMRIATPSATFEYATAAAVHTDGRTFVATSLNYNSFRILALKPDNRVTVNNVGPTPVISGDGEVDEGSPYTLNLSTAMDSGSDTIDHWDIDWGDGSPVERVEGNPASVEHTYASGTETRMITASVTDEDGTYTAVPKTITVNNVAPSLFEMIYDYEMWENSWSPETMIYIADPGGSTIYSGQVDWGDGTTDELWVEPTGDGAYSFLPEHYYPDDAVYEQSFTITDDEGASFTHVVQVTVKNIKPSMALGGAPSADEGGAYTLQLKSQDPGLDTIAQWVIDWGDGSAAQTVPGNTTSVTHTYADGLTQRTITAIATDEDGSYTVNGPVIDTTFGTNGIAVHSFGASGNPTPRGVRTLADGKTLVTGTIANDLFVARFNADGTSDTSFGVGGVAVADLGNGYESGYSVREHTLGYNAAIENTS